VSGLLPPAAIIGGVIGAGLGWLNAQVIAAVVIGRLRAMDRSATQAERDGFEARIRLLSVLVRVILTGGTAAVGYMFGRTLGG
jgi:type III secretory pathway component EscS